MNRRRSVWREYSEALLIAAMFLWFANTFVLQTFYIPSGSMEDTLLIGDHLFVNRFIYGPSQTTAEAKLLPGRPVRRGDIVIFRSPEPPHLDLVKRCVGLPGDEIDVIDKQLYINGKAVPDASYAVHKERELYPDDPGWESRGRTRDQFGPRVVPPGHYFCMGDNRDNSHDSRFWGPLPAHLVKGRAFVIYWSFGGGTSDGRFHGAGDTLLRIGRTIVYFFPKTRWERTFRLIR
jgi:signal peptidase I